MRILRIGGLRLDILGKCAVRDFFADQMPIYAAALAFHLFVALFPFLLFLIALLGFLHLPDLFGWLTEWSARVLPAQALERVTEVIVHLRAEQNGDLLSFGIAGTVWFASVGMRASMAALNAAYDVEESRPIWRRYLLSVAYTVGLAVLVVGATTFMVLGPRAAAWIAAQAGMAEGILSVWTWTRIPMAVALAMCAISIVYTVAPNLEQKFRLVTPGSVVAVALWLLMVSGFSYYVANFGRYEVTYGSIAAVIVLLLYLFMSGVVLLFGAEVNAVIYWSTRRPRAALRRVGDPDSGSERP